VTPLGSLGWGLGSRLRHDDRAVSTTVNYALNLSVAAILMTSLLVASAGFVDDQRERAVRTELRVLGGQLADGISTADRLASAPGTDSVNVTRDLPQTVADRPYTITLHGGTDPYLTLSTTDPAVTVGVNLTTMEGSPGVSIPPGRTSLFGGPIEIDYDGTTDELAITEASNG
jgi:hypothetical protein